jgi:alpha-D-ribose 1-methylphosphonate 5-triphosphate synthase subunit PhnI
LKLPHYVDFQSELVMLRELRRRFHDNQQTREAAE